MRRLDNQRGTASLELVLVVPGLVLLLGVMIAGGRLWFARSDVSESAYTAARSASLARTANEAVAEGQRAGAEALSLRDRRCTSSSVAVDVRAFRAPAGVPAAVTARVVCRVPLADLVLPVLPGSVLVEREASAALDTYRARS
jgi:Flp pilus assembly protein TadG